MEQIDYTSPEFWAKAPEGATHWEPEGFTYNAGWMRFDKDGWWYWGTSKQWERYRADLPKGRVAAMTPRPTHWNGTGLPPVGTVCESLWNEASDTWLKAKVFGANEHGQPILRWEEGPKIYEYQASPLHGPHGTAYFRPIRTPKQIEAEERKLAIVEMLRTVSGAPLSMRKICESLYDAGYRKIDTSQPSPAEISSDIKQANLSLLAEKALEVYATRKEPVGSVVAVNLLELSDLRDLAVSLKDN